MILWDSTGSHIADFLQKNVIFQLALPEFSYADLVFNSPAPP